MEALSFKAKENGLDLAADESIEGSWAGEWPRGNDVGKDYFGNGVDRMDYKKKGMEAERLVIDKGPKLISWQQEEKGKKRIR